MHYLPVVDGRVYIYDIELVKLLREKFHVCGILTGTLAQFPQQNIFGGLPLQLLPEDAKFLLESGDFQAVDDFQQIKAQEYEANDQNGPINLPLTTNAAPTQPIIKPRLIEPDPARYSIYKYLMLKNYFIMPGLRFGCHFMAYPGDLMRYHSHYNVLGFNWDEPFNMLDIVNGGRLATSVKKCWLIGSKNPQTNETEVFSIEWAGFG